MMTQGVEAGPGYEAMNERDVSVSNLHVRSTSGGRQYIEGEIKFSTGSGDDKHIGPIAWLTEGGRGYLMHDDELGDPEKYPQVHQAIAEFLDQQELQKAA